MGNKNEKWKECIDKEMKDKKKKWVKDIEWEEIKKGIKRKYMLVVMIFVIGI
jgi:hypothetical protein